MKYRKKPVVVEAVQWFKIGDHPAVAVYDKGDVSGPCSECGRDNKVGHGWIKTKEGGHIVCPADWIITGVVAENYPCKPTIFAATYEQEGDAT